MARRGGQLPWGSPGDRGGPRGRGRGVYEGGGRQDLRQLGVVIAVAAVILVLVAFGIAQVCGGGCSAPYCKTGDDFRFPDGFERLSDVYRLNPSSTELAGVTGVRIDFDLKRRLDDASNLGVYRYNAETAAWELVGQAELTGDGKTAVASIEGTPQIITVLRRTSPAGHVVAYLPKGGELHGEAAGIVTILHPEDFVPAADGTIAGEPRIFTSDGSFAVFPTITARQEDKTQLIVDSILGNATSRSTHVQAIVKRVQESNLQGIDIAYLNVPADKKAAFLLFVTELSAALHRDGKKLTLTLPLPTVSGNVIDEGGYNWTELAKVADLVQMRPYLGQDKWRLDMPRLIEHLTTTIDPTKLVLGVSPYAVEKGDGYAMMKLAEAMAIATQLSSSRAAEGPVGAGDTINITAVNLNKEELQSGIQWAPECACVNFNYKSGNGRTVFIENWYSLGFKLELIPRYGLGGVSVDNASTDPYLGNAWTAVRPFAQSGHPVLSVPNKGDLQPQWRVDKGTVEDSGRGSIKWSTPLEPGTYKVFLTLSDGVSLFRNELAITVQRKDSGAAASPTSRPQ